MPPIWAFLSAAVLLARGARAASVPASAASPASQTCVDSPASWVDPDGDACDVYAAKGWCKAEWIKRWNSTGRTAREACCKCGGGEQLATAVSDTVSLPVVAAVPRAIAAVVGAGAPKSVAESFAIAPPKKAGVSHDFAGIHPGRLPVDIASAVAEGSIDMATAVAAGVWPPKPNSQRGATTQPAARPVVSPDDNWKASANPWVNTLTAAWPVEASRAEPSAAEASPPELSAAPEVWSAKSQARAPVEVAATEPASRESTNPKDQLREPTIPSPEKQDVAAPIMPLDAAGRRNPLLAWKVDELQKEADKLQTQLNTERQEREDVLRKDGVEIGELQAQTQSERANVQRESSEVQDWKHRAAALQISLNTSQAQQQKEKQDSSASFHRLEKLFHQLERKAETVQGQEKWEHQETQQLHATALKEKKNAVSSKSAESQLQSRLRETASNLTKALSVAAAEKKKNAALNAWKNKATKAIEAQGERLQAEKPLQQKMQTLLAREKKNDHERDEKMYSLQLRLQKAESEKQALRKKTQEQANRITQLEAGDDVSFDADEHAMTQSSSADVSNPTTTTTQDPLVEKATAPLLSSNSWARMIPQDPAPSAKGMSPDSTVGEVPQEIRQSSALWNLWKQSSI